jgi:hypothetical protein
VGWPKHRKKKICQSSTLYTAKMYFKHRGKPGVVAHTYNPSTEEV